MGIILWIVMGAIAGWLASLLMDTDKEQDGLMNVVVGIVGAVLGGWITTLFGATGITGFNIYSLIVAIFGSMVLIAAVKMLRRA